MSATKEKSVAGLLARGNDIAVGAVRVDARYAKIVDRWVRDIGLDSCLRHAHHAAYEGVLDLPAYPETLGQSGCYLATMLESAVHYPRRKESCH